MKKSEIVLGIFAVLIVTSLIANGLHVMLKSSFSACKVN